MLVVRALARPMLASIFIIQGYDTFRHPERVAEKAEPVVRPVAERVAVVPAKAEQAVRVNGAVQMVAGSLLALGRWPRLSALAIAGTLVPTTLAGHRFWEAEDDASKAQQRIHFLKNLTMFGGLLIAAVDTGGKPSLVWRARYALKTANRSAARSAAYDVKAARRTARSARRTAKAARLGAKAAGPVQSTRGAARLARWEAKAAGRTAKTSGKAGITAGKLAGRTAKTSGKAGARAGIAGAKAGILAGRTAKASGKAGVKAGRLARRVSH